MLGLRKTKEPDSRLDKYRRGNKKWWIALPLLALVGVLLWYGITIFKAYRDATADNITGGSSLLSDNKKEDPAADNRINVLLIGVGGEAHPGGTLADSIMVASIDPRAKSIALLSIPRDLYVTLPNGSKDKINAVHALGEKNGTKGGGPALLKQVVSTTLGVPIHYYIRIDFEGFKKIIDTLGGVTVNVKTAINDPLYPDAQMKGYDPFKISTGVHTLDGATALKYARSRETTSDFDRARRQQEIIVAIKDKVLSAQVLANPKKVSSIITILGKHILTDFSASEIDQLVVMAKNFSNPTIRNQVLGSTENGLVVSGRSSVGASIQVPRVGMNDFSEIQAFARAYFASPIIMTEKPTVLIQNSGAAKTAVTSMQKQLEWAGYTVKISDTDSTTEQTTALYDYTNKKKPHSVRYLKDRYDLKPVEKSTDETITTDFVLILGQDFTKATLAPKKDSNTTSQASPSLTLTTSSEKTTL